MVVYVFGNKDNKEDCRALMAANFLKGKIKNIEFKAVLPNEDLPFWGDGVIMDTVSGINKIKIIREIDKISKPKSSTVHDFDLGFQLKYQQKLGKLGKVTIIGIPLEGEVDYFRIQSILRKLVAQDMQGS